MKRKNSSRGDRGDTSWLKRCIALSLKNKIYEGKVRNNSL